MTTSNQIDLFIERLTEYYGEPKNEGMLKWFKSYISKDVDNSRLGELFRFVIHTHSASYGFPSVKEVEDAIKYAIKDHGKDLRPEPEVFHAEAKEIPQEDRIEFTSEGDLFKKIISSLPPRKLADG